LNKTINVLITVVSLFAILGLASVNTAYATPRILKQANLVYSTSVEPIETPTTPWMPVPGNQVSNFKLKLDGSSTTWYYLNIKFIKPLQPNGLFAFYLTPPPASDTAFWTYWANKGVTSAADPTTWQGLMWQIITASKPMFYLSSDGLGKYMLVDGLQYLASGGTVLNNLRLNGDYPLGSYTFSCADPPLDGITMTITFR